MKGSLYRDRDYAFGQTILTLRTTIGLTQTALANVLGRHPPSCGRLGRRPHLSQGGTPESSSLSWPSNSRPFRPGTRQRKFVLSGKQPTRSCCSMKPGLPRFYPMQRHSQHHSQIEKTSGAARTLAPPAGGGPRVDWGDAPTVTTFYGREWELNLLSAWVVQERCRVVSVLGQGGIGKSALATQVMQRVAEYFEVVIWRSLRDVPSCEALLDDCLQVLAPQALHDVSASLESRQGLLVECLRSRRVLLVYDNLESFLEEGEDTGHMRAGYEGFGRVLRRVAETDHQSCLAADQPGETERPRAAGGQPGSSACLAPRPTGCRLLHTAVGRKGRRGQRG